MLRRFLIFILLFICLNIFCIIGANNIIIYHRPYYKQSKNKHSCIYCKPKIDMKFLNSLKKEYFMFYKIYLNKD